MVIKRVSKSLSNKNIRIGFFSVLLLLSFFLTDPIFAIASLISIVIHEFGHIIASKILNVHLSELSLSIFGASLRPDNQLFSYKDEIIICASGPLINFITFMLLFPVYYALCGSTLVLYIALSSLILGLFNLIPIKDMDGGRILRSLLHICLPYYLVDSIMTAVSFISIFLLWLFSVYLLIVTSSGLSPFIFSASLFSKIFLADCVK